MAGFEITLDEVIVVLDAHGIIRAIEYGEEHYKNESERVFALLTDEDKARIGAVEGDVEAKTEAALANVEEFLYEKGVLDREKHRWIFSFKTENEDNDDPHVVVEIRQGSKPEVYLYSSRKEAASNAADQAQSCGQDRDLIFDRLMDEEDGKYDDGDVEVYVVRANR